MGDDVSGVKRFGNYIAAIFKLGRTERLAKEARRSIHEIERSLERLNGWEDRERRLRNSIKQMVQGETQVLMARNAELARNFVELSRRLDQVLLTWGGEQDVVQCRMSKNPRQLGKIGGLKTGALRTLGHTVIHQITWLKNEMPIFYKHLVCAHVRQCTQR